MNPFKLIQCGLLAAVLGLSLTAQTQAGDVVNEASYSIEFNYGISHPTQGFIWYGPVRIDSGYMVTLPPDIDGCPVLASWRLAGSVGDSGWSYITGMDPHRTGYIGEYMTIEFR